MIQTLMHGPTRLLGVARAFDGHRMVSGDVRIGDGKVLEMGIGEGVGDLIAAPGLVDLQLNGFKGVDLQAASIDSIEWMMKELAATGVTAFQPTLISAPLESMKRALGKFDSVREIGGLPRMMPAHLEGPFLAPAFRGAHRLENLLLPDVKVLDELLQEGKVGYITLAPELKGGMELIHHACDRGLVVALGHSDATTDQSVTAFRSGATVLTHALNAHHRFTPRDPGPLAAAAQEGAWVTMIGDGVHLAPLTVTLLDRIARDRLVGISDAMVAAGLGDGRFVFGDLKVTVRDGHAELDGGRLAGSTVTLDGVVRFMVDVGLPLEIALAATTSRPAAVLDNRELGRLRRRGPADIVILDKSLHPVATLIDGVEIARCEGVSP